MQPWFAIYQQSGHAAWLVGERQKKHVFECFFCFFFTCQPLTWFKLSLTSNPFALRTIVVLCNHHHWPCKKTFHHPELKSGPHWTVNLPFPPLFPLLTTIILFYHEEMACFSCLTQEGWYNICPFVCGLFHVTWYLQDSEVVQYEPEFQGFGVWYCPIANI